MDLAGLCDEDGISVRWGFALRLGSWCEALFGLVAKIKKDLYLQILYKQNSSNS